MREQPLTPALTTMLAQICRELGYEDPEAAGAKWIIEREQTVAMRVGWAMGSDEPAIHAYVRVVPASPG